jgi:branched-chain amino acid transport system permease protein
VLLLVLLGTVAALGLGAGPAYAVDEAVQGFLRNDGKPVQGVKVSVAGPEGFTGEATSGADGRWAVSLPGPGEYAVTLDAATLPEGVSLRFPDRNPIETTVNGNQQKSVLFALGQGSQQASNQGDLVLNRFAQGLRFGLLIALAAVGLSLIFGTTGLTNFAHGELVTLGGFAALVINVNLGWPLLVAAVLALVIGGGTGWLLDRGLWLPLRRRGTGLIAMMIVSIGLSIAARYLFLYLFGGSTASYRETQGQTAIGPGPISLTLIDYLSMALCIAMLLAVAYFLLRTRIGKATRAVADNPALAAASGIDVERVIRIVWVSGSALAALSGVLLGIAQQVNFQMGLQILLLIFAGVTLGGLGTAFGALVGSIIVGLFVEMSTLFIPSELKTVGALAILIVILLVRPQGILGRAERVG